MSYTLQCDGYVGKIGRARTIPREKDICFLNSKEGSIYKLTKGKESIGTKFQDVFY